MSKGSGGTRMKAPSGISAVNLFSDGGNAEITDSVRDYYLPQKVRNKLDGIENIKTYAQLEAYLNKQGIELDTDRDAIKTAGRDRVIRSIETLAPQILAAIETYKDVFGAKSLKALKKIKLHDKD